MAKLFVLFFFFGFIAFGDNPSMPHVCNELNLVPASKAIVQWERVFSSEKRMQKYHIDQLSPEVQKLLKAYLIQHAADSSQPMVPGL